jgi:3-methyladenine DNA glycosylase AlkD
MSDRRKREHIINNLTGILQSECATGKKFQSKVIENLIQKNSNPALIDFCKHVMESL